MGQAGAKAPRVLPRVGFKLKDGREIIPPNDIALDSDMFCM